MAAAPPESASLVMSATPPRPRIGLVLSGGGARGAAHAGVLKVLEELNIPIDAVAGTSMGALVGGLYAAGMSAGEIDTLINTLDWQDAFRDRPPRTALGYRRKQDDRNFLVRYSLGVTSGDYKLPLGLVQGQKQTQILRGATLQAADINDFDQLPIPFRAVATDLETGEQVVMRNGDLTTAMRASMSAPGVFTPVEREGRYLIDGGLVNNLPVDVARAMNVDRLIVVDVTFPLLTQKQLLSPLAVSTQAFAIISQQNAARQRDSLGDNDLIIKPALGSMGSSEFSRVSEAERLGEAAARAALPSLASLSLSDVEYAQWQAMRRQREVEPRRIAFVETDADSSRYAELVESIAGDLRGQILDREQVNRRLAELYALDWFEAIDYQLVERGDEAGLRFSFKRKSWGPNYVRIGVNLEDDFAGNSRYNLAARLIMTEVNRLGAEWITDAQIGDQPRLASEFYQPLSVGHPYFVAPRVQFNMRNLEVLDNNRQVAEYRVRELQGGVDVGRELSNWGEVRVGVQRGSGSSRVLIGDPSLPGERYNTGGYFMRFAYDKLDNVFFPKRGQQFTVEWTADREHMGADRDLNKVYAAWLMAQTWGKHTLLVSADVGTTLSNDSATHDYFTLGGFLNLSGVRTDSLSGPHYGIGRVVYYRQIGRGGSGVLDLPAYAGVSFEAGNTWAQRSDASWTSLRHDGSLFFGVDTPIGPLYLAAGMDDRRESAFYLFLGRSF